MERARGCSHEMGRGNPGQPRGVDNMKVVTLGATTIRPGRTGQDSKDSHNAAVRVLLSAEGDSGEKSKFDVSLPN